MRTSIQKTLFVVILFLAPLTLSAQKVSLVTVNQLEQRLKAGRDTIYVINFWATWCAPCIKELPYFDQFASRMKQKPVKVLLVSLDFRSKLESSVRPFVTRLNLQSEVMLLNEKNQQSYIERIDKNWSGAIPATLIVNSKRQSRQLTERELSYGDIVNLYKNTISNE